MAFLVNCGPQKLFSYKLWPAEHFFSRMWPFDQFEFETPELELIKFLSPQTSTLNKRKAELNFSGHESITSKFWEFLTKQSGNSVLKG